MGRLVRISIYSLVILILYFWVTAIIKSYQKNNDNSKVEVVNDIDSIALDSSIVDTTLDTSIIDEAPLTNQDILDGTVNYDAVDKKLEALEEKKSAKTTTIKSTPKPVSNDSYKKKPSGKSTVEPSDGGAYMVMAGSFLLKDNANSRVKKLRTMGYSKAEVVIFQASQYHSVVAARYSSESKARSASDDLKRKGIDSFVKTN